MLRRVMVILGMTAIILFDGCGGSGNSSNAEGPLPAWKNGADAFISQDQGTLTVTFNISKGYFLGLASKDPITGKDTPERIIPLDDAKEVVYTSPRVGDLKTSVARTSWSSSGVTIIPNVPKDDGKSYIFVVLKSGEAIPFSMSDQVSRLAVTGPNVVIGSDGSITYGNYRPNSLKFLKPGMARVDYASNIIGGMAHTINAADVVAVRWISNLTYWRNSVATGTLQRDADGDYFVDIPHLPRADREAYIEAVLKSGELVGLSSANSIWGLPKRSSKPGMDVIAYDDIDPKNPWLGYGDYQSGDLAFDSASGVVTIAYHTDADPIPALGEPVMFIDIAYFQWVSQRTDWYNSPAIGYPYRDVKGDLVVMIPHVPNNDTGYIVVFRKNGTRVGFDPNNPHWGRKPQGLVIQ